MRITSKLGILATGALVATLGVSAVSATPPSGTTGPVIAQGTIDERIKISTSRHRESAVTVQHVTIAPGGSTGWHSHDAEVLAVVAAGTVTLYDHHCRSRTIYLHEGFTEEPGGVHLARNQGDVPVEVFVTYVSRPGAALRVDEAAPRGCAPR